MGGSKGIDMLSMTKDRTMLDSQTSVNFVIPSPHVLSKEVKKVVSDSRDLSIALLVNAFVQ